MGTHPIFESDFDCLTEKMLRMSHSIRIIRKVKTYDFIKTVSAEDSNLREHGFRRVGSRLVDTSALVHAHALYSDQNHYAYVPGLPELPIAKVLNAGSDSEAIQLFKMEYASLTHIEKLLILQRLHSRINAKQPLLVGGAIDVFNHVPGCDPEFLLPVLVFAQRMGFGRDSNVMKNIERAIMTHINDIGLVDAARINELFALFPDYPDSELEQLLYRRATQLARQLELKTALLEENISGLSDLTNPVLIGMVIKLLRFPKDRRFLATGEAVLFNQAQAEQQSQKRNDRECLAESLFLAKIFLEDQRLNKRNLFLPEHFKDFGKSETVCLISSVFGMKYFEAAVEDLTNEEEIEIETVYSQFQAMINECSEEVAQRYLEAFEMYCDALDLAEIEIRNVGGIFALLVGEDVGLMYARKDAFNHQRPLVKLHTASPIP